MRTRRVLPAAFTYQMSIYKACDIRGEFGTELFAAHGTWLGYALAKRTGSADVLVGGDARVSTPTLKRALVEALLDAGARVFDLGAVPTPVFYFARRVLEIPVGVMVTASHNPPEDNGFKIILGELPITEADLDALRKLIESQTRPSGRERGEYKSISIFHRYEEFVQSLFEERGTLRIVLDCGNGMWGPIAPRVFRRLGYDVIELFSEVDGRFPNRSPNPAIASNLRALAAKVRETGAALGIAYDGDGDRVAFVDERGDPVDNDRVIVLFARNALTRSPGAVIVYDQKCSDVVREEIERNGGVPLIEKSGHTFIKTTFLKSNAAYAGELSGHHFLKETHCDDALIASLFFAQWLQTIGQPLSRVTAQIPRYAITPDIRLRVAPGEAKVIIDAVAQNIQGAIELDRRDGVRVRFIDGWGLVRASVTEPAITLRFEGRSVESLERIKREFVRAAPPLEGRI